MNKKEFKLKTITELNEELTSLYKKKFKLILEKTSGVEIKTNHQFKKIKKNIAQILTIIKEKRDKK